jgi:hypothetical protein
MRCFCVGFVCKEHGICNVGGDGNILQTFFECGGLWDGKKMDAPEG